MVAPRSEPGRASEEKPPGREAKPESAPPAASESRSPRWQDWLPLGAALLLMPAVAYATTTFVLLPQLQKALHSATASAPPAAATAPHAEANSRSESESPPLADGKQSKTFNKLLVNVAGTMGSRYLLTSITILSDTADFSTRVDQHEPQLRDMASGILNTKTIADLEKPGARNLIRGELLAGFNTILGKSAVKEIYFTEFAIQ
jgi:flagellar protein FliL